MKLLRNPPAPTQIIYFTTAVAAGRGGPAVPISSTQAALLPAVHPFLEESNSASSNDELPAVRDGQRNLSSVAIQGPIVPIPLSGVTGEDSCRMRDGRGHDGRGDGRGTDGLSLPHVGTHGHGASASSSSVVDVHPTPPTTLPPLRPGSPSSARPMTPTDSAHSGPLTPHSIVSEGRRSPSGATSDAQSDAGSEARMLSSNGPSSSSDLGRTPSSSAGGATHMSSGGLDSRSLDRSLSRAPRPGEPVGGGTLHSLSSSGRGCSTSCIPSWPVLNMLLHPKVSRPSANKMGSR